MSNERRRQDEDRKITPKSVDFSRWYVDVVRRAELADYSPVKGCMVIRPYGYAIWENARNLLDARIKATGHQNAYFPMFIPESFLKKEAEHVEGFAPEVAWVTHGGAEELEERLAVRPTSEAIICSMYSKWVQSYRDLPVLINQWANIVRWEKVTRFFLRTTEFLWQEGHTCHATFEEAEQESLTILHEVYRRFYEKDLAVPVVAGRKSEREKFAGALHTYTIEALMSDGRALQAGTSHNLGQNFSKAFDIKFEDADQEIKYAWGTSWGVSTRLMGALIMAHGDDHGLILPPSIAPYHVVIVPIPGKADFEMDILPAAHRLRDILAGEGIRVYLDDRTGYTPGWKYNEWEMRGVPLRAEIGPRDIAKEQTVLVRRDNREKAFVPFDGVVEAARNLLDELQRAIFESASDFMTESTQEVTDYDTFLSLMKGRPGFLDCAWCGDRECEEAIKDDTSATIRCLPLEPAAPGGTCVRCDNPAQHRALFAKAY